VRHRRISDETAAVLSTFLEEPARSHYGRGILRDTGIQSGSLYPILHRLEDRGLVTAAWEDIQEALDEGRRPRRLYTLDQDHLEAARDLIAEWQLAREEPGRTRVRNGATGRPSVSTS
jgi:PadR family transcriptional regulator PadR